MDLVSLLWDPSAVHYIATLKPGGKLRTQVCTQVPRAADDANTYFAPANFADPAAGRKQSNVLSIRAFWLDVDCKNDGYKDKETAADALVGFCQTWVTKPSAVVDSGGGLHVYWILEEAIDPEIWKKAAKRLRQACMLAGFRADHSRTTDYSSLMRLPGSWNWSSNSAVTILYEGDLIQLQEFTLKFPMIEEHADAAFVIPFNVPPGDASLIAKKCPAMRMVYEAKGDVTEPLWYAALQVLAHCTDPEPTALEWSEGHPEFDPQETLDKLSRASAFGPTTCLRFESLGAPCDICEHRGKLTSPITLGRETTPIVVPPVQEDRKISTTLDLPAALRSKYTVGDEGVWTTGHDDESVLVVWIPMVVDGVGQQSDGGAVAQIRWRTPTGTWRRSDLPLVVLAEPRELNKWLLDKAITLFHKERIAMYLRDFVTSFLNDQDPAPIVTRFGWNETLDGFFLGDRLISEKEVKRVRVAQHVPSKLVQELSSIGQPDKWAKATNGLEAYPYHAFALLASLASPILHLCDVQGAVLSLAGDSGVGKTVASKMAISVWGSADALQVAPQATQNAKGEMFRLARHLPVLIDDVTQAQFQQMSELVYMAANGRAKERVARDGRMKGSDDWQLVALVTTNSPLHEMPHRLLGEAERRRILELPVTEAMPREMLLKMIDATRHHAGSPAAVYLQAVASFGVEGVRTLFNQIAEKIHMQGIPDVQRFSVWLAAAASVAGAIAQDAGIIQFNPVTVVKKVVEAMSIVSEEDLPPDVRTERLIAEYINHHVRNFTIKARHTWIDTDVYGAVAGTIKVDAQVVAIPVSKLNEWFQTHRMPTAHLKRWMRAHNVARHLELMARTGAREYCYYIPMDQAQIEALQAKSGI